MGKRYAVIMLSAAATLACGACETVFVQPADTADAARVSYARDPELGTYGTGQILSWSSGAECGEVLKIAAFDPMSKIFAGQTSSTFRLQGGQRTHLLAEIYGQPRAAYAVVTGCTNLISFTPRPGGNYALAQRFNGGDCTTGVVDQETGAPPADLVMHPLAPDCRRIPNGYYALPE
jgi:hypothetical protein